MTTLSDQAIQAALSGDWQNAASINAQILQDDPNNVDALNRLAYARAKAGDFQKACEIYKQVLSLDPYNPLALKNSHKFKLQNHTCQPNSLHNHQTISPSLFLTDAEKTKIVKLINIAPKETIQNVSIGEEIFAHPKRFEMHLTLQNGTYIGKLPDDVGHPLLKQYKTSNKTHCTFFVKDVSEQQVLVFIRY